MATSGTADERSPAWALPLVALGLCLVACGVLIPAAEANRQIEAERRELAADVASLKTRVEMNDDFLARLHRDSDLAERLERRQRPPESSEDIAVLASDASALDGDRRGLSPFAMLRPEPTVAEPPPEVGGGLLAQWCRDERGRLGVVGTGLMCGLLGLLAGGGKGECDDDVTSDA